MFLSITADQVTEDLDISRFLFDLETLQHENQLSMAVVASSLNIAMSFFLLFYHSFKNISPLNILFGNY